MRRPGRSGRSSSCSACWRVPCAGRARRGLRGCMQRRRDTSPSTRSRLLDTRTGLGAPEAAVARRPAPSPSHVLGRRRRPRHRRRRRRPQRHRHRPHRRRLHHRLARRHHPTRRLQPQLHRRPNHPQPRHRPRRRRRQDRPLQRPRHRPPHRRRRRLLLHRPAAGFTALAPARLLDTRSGVGGASRDTGAADRHHRPCTSPARGGVPATGVSAVVLNVTATDPTAAGYITVLPDRHNPTHRLQPQLHRRPNHPQPRHRPRRRRRQNRPLQRIRRHRRPHRRRRRLLPPPDADTGFTAAGAGPARSTPAARIAAARRHRPSPPPAPSPSPSPARGGVPATGVAAVVLNVTATDPTGRRLHHRLARPAQPDPTASNLNFTAARPSPTSSSPPSAPTARSPSTTDAAPSTSSPTSPATSPCRAGPGPRRSPRHPRRPPARPPHRPRRAPRRPQCQPVQPTSGPRVGPSTHPESFRLTPGARAYNGDVRSVTGTATTGGTVLLWPQAAPPAVGGHLAILPSPPAPSGMSGHVTSVLLQADGSWAVTVVPGDLQDIFEELVIDDTGWVTASSSRGKGAIGASGIIDVHDVRDVSGVSGVRLLRRRRWCRRAGHRPRTRRLIRLRPGGRARSPRAHRHGTRELVGRTGGVDLLHDQHTFGGDGGDRPRHPGGRSRVRGDGLG